MVLEINLILGYDWYDLFTSTPKEIFVCCSPVSPYTNVAPLAIVLIVSLIKEAFEDWVRNTSSYFRRLIDCYINNFFFYLYENGKSI